MSTYKNSEAYGSCTLESQGYRNLYKEYIMRDEPSLIPVEKSSKEARSTGSPVVAQAYGLRRSVDQAM